MNTSADTASAKKVVERAAVLLVGSELLNGKIADQNLHALAGTLRALGIQLARALIVPDEREIIATEVLNLSRDHDVVFTSGGVGPTHDDLTIEAVAQAFSVPTEINPQLFGMLQREYGAVPSDGYRRMALLPRGARLLSTKDVRWPTIVMHNVWLLPGVPEIFRLKLQVVREHLEGPVRFFSRAAYTKLDEAMLKARIDATVERFPDIEVGSYPKWFDETYRTKVTFDGIDAPRVNQALDDFCSRLPEGEPVRVE